MMIADRILKAFLGILFLCIPAGCDIPSPKTENEGPRRDAIAVQTVGGHLQWMRCSVGQTWDGWKCDGFKKRMNFQEASTACPSGFRLPTRAELLTLLAGCDSHVAAGQNGTCNACGESKETECASMLSGVVDYNWTSTPAADNRMWAVCLDCGRVFAQKTDESYGAICVKDV